MTCFAGSTTRCKEHLFVKCKKKDNLIVYTLDQRESLAQVEADYDRDLPKTPPNKKAKLDEDSSDSISPNIPIIMSENRVSKLRSYLVRFVLTTHAGINSLDNYWLAQAMETLRPKCTKTAGISASNLSTSQIPKELVKAEKLLSQEIANSDFSVIEVDGWGPSKKHSSL